MLYSVALGGNRHIRIVGCKIKGKGKGGGRGERGKNG